MKTTQFKSDFEIVRRVYQPWIQNCADLKEIALQQARAYDLKPDKRALDLKPDEDMRKAKSNEIIAQTIVTKFLETECAIDFFSNISSFRWVDSNPDYSSMMSSMWSAYWGLVEFKTFRSSAELGRAINSLGPHKKSSQSNEPMMMQFITFDSIESISDSIKILGSCEGVPSIAEHMKANKKLTEGLEGNRETIYRIIADYTAMSDHWPNLHPPTLRRENNRYKKRSDTKTDLLQKNYQAALIRYLHSKSRPKR
jgi:hypothetical protein